MNASLQLVPGLAQLLILLRQLPTQHAQLEVSAYPADHLGQLQRLGDIIDAPGVEPCQPVLQIVQGCHENDGNVLGSSSELQAPTDRQAVLSRHHDVEQDEIRQLAWGPPQPLGRAVGDRYLVPLGLQQVEHDAEVRGNIINEQDVSGRLTHDELPRYPTALVSARTPLLSIPCCNAAPTPWQQSVYALVADRTKSTIQWFGAVRDGCYFRAAWFASRKSRRDCGAWPVNSWTSS